MVNLPSPHVGYTLSVKQALVDLCTLPSPRCMGETCGSGLSLVYATCRCHLYNGYMPVVAYKPPSRHKTNTPTFDAGNPNASPKPHACSGENALIRPQVPMKLGAGESLSNLDVTQQVGSKRPRGKPTNQLPIKYDLTMVTSNGLTIQEGDSCCGWTKPHHDKPFLVFRGESYHSRVSERCCDMDFHPHENHLGPPVERLE